MRARRRKEKRGRRGGRLRRWLFSRLFFKIYLTLIACLAAVAVASGIYWGGLLEDEAAGFGDRRDQFLAEMLPSGEDPATTRETLERMARATGAAIAVYSSEGDLIASAGRGRPPPPPPPKYFDDDDDHDDFDKLGLLSARLPDGRVVAARWDRPWRGRGPGPLLYIALIALVVAAAAWPVVRHLTRRLERLRRGVDSFGGGALSTRVRVEGGDEVAAVAASFNAAADHIEKLVSAHRALLANASHELRSPVARLRMAIDLTEGGAGDAAHREIVDNLGEIDQLVDEILLASRLDHIEGLERPERLDLLALVAEEGARHGVEVSGAPAEITGDARLVTRLVRNLMVNALKHGARPVTAEVSRGAGGVQLAVRDHGAGIPDAEATRIFEPFYRPQGRAEAAGGWGLGLSLVRQIAEHHGATVRVETPADGGARFVVTFP